MTGVFDNFKIGWGISRAKFYHKVRPRKGFIYSKSIRWFDCNSWERKPHEDATEAIALGLKPCPRCFNKRENNNG